MGQQRETFTAPARFKKLDAASGEFTGVASVFGAMVDAFVPTRVLRGAFTKTLDAQGDRVSLLWQHDPAQVIGLPLALKEIGEGLFLHGKIFPTSLGKDVMTLFQGWHSEGRAFPLSIGFDPIREETVTEADGAKVRHLHEVRLWEVSAVTWGADAQAGTISVAARPMAFHEQRRLVDQELERLEARGVGGLSRERVTMMRAEIDAQLRAAGGRR